VSSSVQTPQIVDLEALVAPVPGPRPGGEDLRLDFTSGADFQRLRDLRARVRAQERAADAADDDTRPIAEWREIVALGSDLLTGRSKDLEVAAVMVEGLARLHGYAGLRDGFGLIHALAEQYWDGLFPEPDEDGVATKVRPITGLNGEGGEGTLIQPLRRIPLIRGQQQQYALWQIIQAGEIASLEPSQRQQRLDAGAADLEAIRTAAQDMAAAAVDTLLADIEAAQDAFQRLCSLLDERSGADSPPSSNIRNVLQAARDAVFLALGNRGEALRAAQEAAQSPAEALSVGAAVPDPSAQTAARPGQIRNREDAFRLIEQAAAWFRQMEPQAVISYTLADAVRRARLPLPELLEELLRDETARGDFLITAGVKPRIGE
jgi:type VI secretion system protein ImpA